MTYLSEVKKGKLSVFILNLTTNQNVTSTSYQDVELETGYETIINQYSVSLTIDTTDNQVTLPAGKFYLDARMMTKRSSSSTWGSEYIWYEWDGSSKNQLGYEGKECGSIAIGDPNKNEHARAYVESDGTAIIGMQVKKTGTGNVEIEDTQYDHYSGLGRCMIWRIE
jgi:hypothetical protein